MLGQAAGAPNVGGTFNSGLKGGGPSNADMQSTVQWFDNHFGVVILLGGLGFILVLLIIALIKWLSSRAEFMFLDGVVTGTPAIGDSWSATKEQGNSLFFFRFIVASISFSLAALAILGALPFVLSALRSGKDLESSLLSSITVAIILVPVGIAISISELFIDDFVVPIMYRRRIKFIAAFKIFWQLFQRNLGTFAFYWLVRVGIALGIRLIAAIITMLACCLTCGILALPILAALPSLPFITFRRAFSLFYIEQFGPEWEIFTRLPQPFLPQPFPPPIDGNATLVAPPPPGY
ncbi:MAG: hypothetical protein ABI579_10060 [Candidatus Sumerlaeota bacterium]